MYFLPVEVFLMYFETLCVFSRSLSLEKTIDVMDVNNMDGSHVRDAAV